MATCAQVVEEEGVSARAANMGAAAAPWTRRRRACLERFADRINYVQASAGASEAACAAASGLRRRWVGHRNV